MVFNNLNSQQKLKEKPSKYNLIFALTFVRIDHNHLDLSVVICPTLKRIQSYVTGKIYLLY